MKKSRELFLFVAVVIAYAIFAAMYPFVASFVNSTFYAGGNVHYRLTWTHYVLPFVIAVFTFYGLLYADEYLGKRVSDSIWTLAVLLVVYFVAYWVGLYIFDLTFHFTGGVTARIMGWSYWQTVYNDFFFLPYWAALPGLLGGWLAVYLMRRSA